MGRFFSLKGINWWMLASAIGINFIWATGMLLGFAFLLDQGEADQGVLQLLMFLICFGLPFLAAWLTARMAGDDLGPNYGMYGSLGAAIPLLLVLGTTGIFGVILSLTTILGGLNGGMLSLHRAKR
jgi:hypothetical protein